MIRVECNEEDVKVPNQSPLTHARLIVGAVIAAVVVISVAGFWWHGFAPLKVGSGAGAGRNATYHHPGFDSDSTIGSYDVPFVANATAYLETSLYNSSRFDVSSNGFGTDAVSSRTPRCGSRKIPTCIHGSPRTLCPFTGSTIPSHSALDVILNVPFGKCTGVGAGTTETIDVLPWRFTVLGVSSRTQEVPTAATFNITHRHGCSAATG